MSDNTTGAMQHFDVQHVGVKKRSPQAGLVLLYAQDLNHLPPAFVLYGNATLGRDEDCDFMVRVPAVSRQHAEIFKKGASWFIRDLNSTNGTIVDGRRVEEAELEQDSEVRIGDAIFKFVESGAQEFSAFPLAESKESRQAPAMQMVGGLQVNELNAALTSIASSSLSILILGESGTGKEVAAHQVHQQSKRSGKFCALNCAALPENLIESELFGYKKGAFSGAERDKKGLIQAAHQGTLFLDEIGDMPAAAQAKLLRVLQSREVLPVGATQAEKVDIRILAATHRDLVKLQETGHFRPDLYSRINEFQLTLPPLRERKEDIYRLTLEFLKRHEQATLKPSFQFMAGLLHHDWPYNIRELESAIKRASALCSTDELSEALLPEPVKQAIMDYAQPTELRPSGNIVEKDELIRLLRQESGNIAAVGRQLGKARMQVHRWLKKYEITVEEFRSDDSVSKI